LGKGKKLPKKKKNTFTSLPFHLSPSFYSLTPEKRGKTTLFEKLFIIIEIVLDKHKRKL